ncbi:MAG: sporulation integral membrane protein YtvI [Eubacterium sp.]|nr:sporulation integral membrane protein YtvI [Eubacterium sp.]
MKQSTKYLKIFCNLAWALVVLWIVIVILPRIAVFFMPFVVGFILSLIANPLVRFLEKKIRIKRKYGTVLIIVFVISAVLLLCYGILAGLAVGVRGFMDYLPTMSANAETEIIAAIESLEAMIRKVPFFNEFNVTELESAVTNMLSGMVVGEDSITVSALGGIAKNLPNMLVSGIMGLLATYFFIADRDRLAEMLNSRLPNSFQKTTMQMYGQILKAVGGYFQAQLKIMGVIYVVVTAGLMLLRVNYAWLIGFGIAFLDMLPVFGTGTVLTPWAIVKFFSGNYMQAVGMLVLYVVSLLVHQLIQPKLIGASVGMHPFATLFFMYIGYQFSGVLGMVIAIPIGMLFIYFYKAGAFDGILWCFREITEDFNRFRKIDHKKNEENKK